MRPVALHIEGFGIFREPVDLDFDGVDYFALVGPTGAGKSTVIDAICFALYGSIPRYGDERLVHRAVSAGALQAKVCLTFDIGTARYQATRVVRVKNGKATTPEALLERVDAGSELLAGRPRDMRPAVERLLGLPFAHFTKCVVLPQGEFARFLHDDPAKRRDLLSRLLDLQVYERVGQRARQQADLAKHAIEHYERQLAEYAYATADARAEADARVTALLDLYGRVDAARPRDAELAAAIEAADLGARGAARVTALLSDVRFPADAAAVAGEADAAREALVSATKARVTAEEACASADAHLDAIGDRAEFARVRDAYLELEALAGPVAEAARTATEAAETSERVRTAIVAAEAHVSDAAAALQTARAAHAAHALAGDLRAGDPCPVCMQSVAHVPKMKRPAALKKTEATLARDQALLEQARSTLDLALREEATRNTAFQRLDAQRQTYAQVIAAHPDRGAAERALAEIDVTVAHAREARAIEKRPRGAETNAVASVRSYDERLQLLRDEFRGRRDTFVREALDPPPATDDLAADWRSLEAWAVAERSVQRDTADAAAAALAGAHEERGALVSELAAGARDLGIDTAGGDLGALRDAVIEAGHDARQELARIADAIEKAAKLTVERQAAREEHDVAQLLGEVMKSNRFEKWVLTEAIELLVDAASTTLLALSAGQYSLRYSPDDEFCVVDHADADEVRSVKTLSGGETFQASLALALALSDQIAALSAAGGTKLEAIFLDEGFGTLDADTLETVATTIETLGTSGRMVGVVTHVPALAERVPVRFRVARTDHAATVTREES